MQGMQRTAFRLVARRQAASGFKAQVASRAPPGNLRLETACDLASESSRSESWRRGGGRGRKVLLSCELSGWHPILWRFFTGFFGLPPQKGGIPKGFACPRPSPGEAAHKTQADRAPAMRT